MQDEQALDAYTKKMALLFEQKESEDNWQKFEECVIRFTEMTISSSHYPSYTVFVKTRLKNALIQTLITDRTRLARTSLNLVTTMATSMGDKFEQLSDLLLPTVLRLTTRANKVYVSSATATLKACIKAAGLTTLIPTLLEGLKNPSKSMRIASIEAILLIVEKNGPHRLQNSVTLIEKAILDGVQDPTHEVRDTAKTLFENYKVGFNDSLLRFQDCLPDMARKYLKVDEPRSLNKTNNQKSNTQAKPKRNSTLTKSSKYSSTSSLAENENSQISRSLSMKSDLESNGSQTSHTDLSQSNSKLYGNFHGSKESINNSKPDSITETPRSQGPQRVVRNLSTSTLTKPKLKPAQRITVAASSIPSMEKLNISVADEKSDSTMPESVVSPELKHSLFKRSSGIPQSSNASKSRIAALRAATTIPKKIINFKPPPGIQMEKAASLTRLNTESLNSDWAVRKEVYEQLEKFFLNTNGDTRDYLSAHSEKSFKMMINGLNDGHFKVVLAAQAALLAFIDCPDLPSSILDVLLPMVATVAFYPLQKTKLSIIEKSKDIVYKILLRTSPQTVGQSVANSLVNSPLSSKNRIGVIGFLNSLSLESLGLLFSKPIVCKALAVRLASFLSDQDPAVLAMLKAVFNNLWEVYPEYLIAGLANITLSDRDSLYHLTGKSFLTLPDAVQTSGLPALTISQFESPSETKQHLIESVALETPTKTVVSVIDIDLSDKTPKSDFKSSNLKSKKSVSLVSKNSTKKISETIKVVENQEVVGENEKQSLENIRIALDKKPEPRTISNLTPKQRESIAANRASLSKSQELNSDKSARRTPNSTLGSPTRVKSRKTPALLDEMETPKSSTKRVFVPLNDIVSAKAVVVPSPQLSVDGASPKKSMFSKMLESKSPVFGQVTPPSIDQQSLPSPSWSPSNEGKNTNPAIRKDARQESKLVTELPHFHNAADQTPKKRDSVLDNQRPDKSSPDSEKPETLQNLENGNIADLPNNATNSLGLSISGVSLEPTSSSENEISAPSTPRPRASSEAKRSLSIGRSSIRKRQESNTNTLAKLVNSFYVNVSIPLKKRLEDLYGALLALNSPIEQDMATSLLKCLFRLEDEEMSEMLEISYTLDLTFHEIEKQLDPKLLLGSINEAIEAEFGLKSGLEIAKRIIGKIENDGTEMPEDAALVGHIIDGLNANQTSVRKAANELTVALIATKNEDWVELFYTSVRSGIGAPREKVLRAMVENQRRRNA